MVQTILAAEFGDILVDCRGEHPVVTCAPPYARIHLAALADDHIHVSDGTLVIAGQVAYRVLDVDGPNVVLICELAQDMRPLLVQAADRAGRR